MQIEDSDEQSEKASGLMRESFDFGSNVTCARLLQFSKELRPTVSTDDGMQIDRSE
jgi:hypothetical protein